MNISMLMEILDQNKFVVEKSEMFLADDREFMYSYNSEINYGFIIKEYKGKNFGTKQILDDVLNARVLLKKHDVNIWNSYYLVLIDEKLSIDSELKNHLYNIERNSNGLRKYVIIDKDDLLRIPFIKTNQENILQLNFSSSLIDVLSTDDEEVESLINWIIKEEGEFQELKRTELKGKINKLFIGND